MQAQELIDYAFHRGIRVLPEFDMPGGLGAYSCFLICLTCQVGYVLFILFDMPGGLGALPGALLLLATGNLCMAVYTS